MNNQARDIPPDTRRRFGRHEVEVHSSEMARSLINNKALPISQAEREDLRRLRDRLEEQGK